MLNMVEKIAVLSPTVEEAASVGDEIGSAVDEHAQHGEKFAFLSPAAEEGALAGS